MNSEHTNFWSQPWSFKQGFLLAFSFSFLGFLLELSIKGNIVPFPSFPINLIVLGALLVITVSIFFVFRHKTIIRFFSSIHAAIPAITVFVIIVLIMGLIPQKEEASGWIQRLGLNHLLHHWMFYCSFLYLLWILIFTVCKRFFPFSIRNIPFLLNHFGLLVILTAGVFGAGDMYRIKMVCGYNQPVWYGTDEKGKMFELPLALELTDFSIEYYNPEIVVVDNATGKPIDFKAKPDPFLTPKKQIEFAKDLELLVDTLYLHSLKVNDKFYPIDNVGATQAAKVMIKDLSSGKVISDGWIAAESFVQPAQYLDLSTFSIFMAPPNPKKYCSVLKLFTPDMNPKMITLEVNKPYYCNGWKLYQVSYDDQKGKWSEYSVIEAVRDPWLPVVYTGIGMLILGALTMIFQIRKKETHE